MVASFIHYSSFILAQLVFQDHTADLTDLIRFRLASVTLQIDFLRNALLPEDMLAASYTLCKSSVSQQATQLVKADICIRLALKNLLQELFVLTYERKARTVEYRPAGLA